MVLSKVRELPFVGLALVFQALLGCGGSEEVATVSGTVYYDGKELEKGIISFYPTDGQGGTAGGEINKGKYEIKNVIPGKKRVQITGQAATEVELVQVKNRAGVEEERHSKKQDPAVGSQQVSAKAQGNNQVVDIPVGKQTRDFKLEKPVGE